MVKKAVLLLTAALSGQEYWQRSWNVWSREKKICKRISNRRRYLESADGYAKNAWCEEVAEDVSLRWQISPGLNWKPEEGIYA